MATWLLRVLSEIHRSAKRGAVRFTDKARSETAELGCSIPDVCEILIGLDEEDFFQRLKSVHTAEWMYVFKPTMVGAVLYLKVVLRSGCVIISFHEDDDDDDPEGQ